MYLSKLKILGYKAFKDEFTINFNEGLTVLIGENGSGKTAVIDAIRLLLNEDEFGRIGITDSHFHRPISNIKNAEAAKTIEVKAMFSSLIELEQVAYLPWLDASDNTVAYLNKKIDNKQNGRGRFDHTIWGGESTLGIFEWDLLNSINCIYLPPLRDAESKLEAYRGSRLSRLFRKHKPKKGEPLHNLEVKFNEFNKILIQDETVINVNETINKYLKESLGTVLGQDTLIQFSESNYDRIVERLRILFYPSISKATLPEHFRDISENSLGYNNILYLATVLAELDELENQDTKHKILLIEEPEAHLHPQLQIKLLQYLQAQSTINNIQIIVTSHSATITAACGLNSLNVLTTNNDGILKSTLISECQIQEETTFFLERWLDITKSTLFFAKGILFVEGIAEAIVIKELSKIVIKKYTENEENPPQTLDDYSVSIINLNGIYFNHFMQIFRGYYIDSTLNPIAVEHIPIKCAAITDCDPIKLEKPTHDKPCNCLNPQFYLQKEFENNSIYCRMFSNLKTFEYDLAVESNNLLTMIKIFSHWLDTDGANKTKLTDWISELSNWNPQQWDNKTGKKYDIAYELLDLIDSCKNKNAQVMGKGQFAQKLAYYIHEGKNTFVVPKYIEDAILWATNIKPTPDGKQ